MVCLGNICRSPLAEGILKSKVKIENLDVEVHSAGTAAYHVGESADPRSVKVAQKNSIDLRSHVGRQFQTSDFDRYDLIYSMDSSNYADIIGKARTGSDKSKVKMLMNELYPGENFDVPDPYFGGSSGFDDVFRMIDQACDIIVDKLKNPNQ
jgi:protein-tyrosine phosphatase